MVRIGRGMDGGTRKCTVHVNPYGGNADIRSHLGGMLMLLYVFLSYPLFELCSLPLVFFRESSIDGTITYVVLNRAQCLTIPLLLWLSLSFLLLISHNPLVSSPTQPPFQDTFISNRLIASNTQTTPTVSGCIAFRPADAFLSLHRLFLDKHFVREQGLGMTTG